MDRLPEDVLAGILSRLAPRSLATSRAVCRWWRAAVDARGLLRTSHLPVRLGGIFVNLFGPAPSEFFARPSSSSPTTRPEISGNLERYVTPSSHAIMDMDWPPSVAGSCNGLLLVNKRVVNPATRQWLRLPKYPPLPEGLRGAADDCHECLVFDPAVSMSPHYYEVLLVPYAYTDERGGSKVGNLAEGSHRQQWPPSPCVVHAFSSRNTRWEQRLFVREAGQESQDAGTVVPDPQKYSYYGAPTYCHGALYLHCQGHSVMRLTLSSDTYKVFKLPAAAVDASTWHLRDHHLGKSAKGVYFALVLDSYKLKVWFLDESGGTVQWVLTHDASLKPVLAHFNWPASSDDATGKFWTVQDDDDTERATVLDENLGWDSDDDNIHDIEDSGENLEFEYDIATIFGFHPFREVVFLRLGNDRIIAYHLNSSTFKVQDMGLCEVESLGKTISDAFVYTPCWIRELFDGNV